ncbi:putative leucine-rich repeat-containing protein DDB_G0290503 [Apis laboriosa]|uniref:putative leucine-rich repeat-containing protein DDB_G0290503 n=1 Tax=Apis laboriosa TaxID=183418 RepID=UPI001CC3DD6F|nr:putative leucine-rich repeat-containing protein DDB_G0290503 [Apis laboriosa]
MSGKLEYLEKYSVAPSPSRDYYGLKVFDDQVILYLWRISHGPHKTPIVQTSCFADFKQDHQLQDEIQRIFGEYFLKHVRNITSGRNTLLTLPKCLINKLIKYLTVKDIIKLTSLSHISKEIFDDNFVWEALYKKYNPLKKYKYENLYIPCNWKQLFQLEQVEIFEQKMNRPRTTARQKSVNSKIETTMKGNPKIENLAKANTKIENSIKVSTSNTKITSKFAPLENQIAKKDTNRKKNINTLSRKLSDNYLNEPTIEKEKVTSEKKTPIIKSLQTIGQKNIKILRDQSIINKLESKRETDNKDLISNKTSEIKMNKFQNKVKKIDTKTSNVSIKMMDDKVNNTKPKSTPTPKIKTNEKSVTPKLKSKGKTKKIGQSKSTILSTTSDLLIDNSAVKDDSFDLADLIEASLKSIRSPRSMFDYNFSCIDKPKSCGGDTLAQEISRKMSDHPRAPKSGHANKAALDRLSEKSEPLTAKSVDSVNKIERARAIATPRYLKGLSADLKKSIELSKSRGIMSLDEKVLDQFEKYTYNKYSTPSIQDDIEQKKFTPRKEMDKINILRSLGTKNFHSKNLSSNAMNEINRYDAKKSMTMNNIYKYL